MNDIEKAARLMGLPLSELHDDIGDNGGIERHGWNPRTNKADLMDVETELSDKYTINTTADDNGFYIELYDTFSGKSIGFATEFMRDHPTKFAARAEAVLSVVSQLYDAKYGKDGE